MVEKIPLRKAIPTRHLPAIAAFGNPLLDFLIILENDSLLRKYNLKIDDEVELPNKIIQQIIADLSSGQEQRISAGGCAQNSMRILQWLCDETHEYQYTVYYGSIGNDARAILLDQLVQASGIDARYATQLSYPTGVRGSLITKSARSFIANIGAAGIYTMKDLRKQKLPLDTVRVIYIEGFFITHSLDVAKELVKQAQERRIIVAFNLNSEYIFKDHHSAICEMVGLANIVFGNAREMTALAQVLNLKFDDVMDIPFLLNYLKRITVEFSSASKDNWLSSDGVFVMSQGGSEPAIVVWGRGQSVQVQPVVPNVPIVDTTGAGDSLVAGFLTGVLANWDPKTCLEFGCKVASFIITRLGVTLPNDVPPNLLE